MNSEINDVSRDLDLIICKKERVSPIIAKKWKWRILNEYPEDIKNLVFAWASEAELPKTEYNNISIQRIIEATPLSFMDAIDLLYILYKDPASGYEIFSRSIRRDAVRRR